MPKGETYVKVTGEVLNIVRLRPAYMSFGGYHWLSDLVRIAFYMAKRWPITAETKALVIEKANQAIHDAALENDSRTMHRYMKILVEAEKQNQADEHLQEEHERIDQGKLTGNIGHTVILDGPIRPQKHIESTIIGEPAKLPDGTLKALPPLQPFSQYNPNDEANKLTPEQIKQAKGQGLTPKESHDKLP